MKEGLALFGDNAYLNSSFLATLYPNVRSGSCDDYNYYHLQVSVVFYSVYLFFSYVISNYFKTSVTNSC